MSVAVALVSASAEVRTSFATVVAEAPEVELVDVLAGSEELATLIEETPGLEVVVIDAGLPDQPALDVVRELALNSPLVATLVIGNPHAILAAAVSAGARGVLALPLSLQELQAQLDSATAWSRSLRQHLTGDLVGGGRGERGRVLALAGAKGGVGVSVLATVLATQAAADGRAVCLVDLDLRGGDLGYLCGVQARRTIADLAGLAGDLTIRGIREVVVDVPAGFVLLAAPDRVEQAEDVPALAVRQVLNELRRHFALVVVDTGSALDDPRAVALEVADEVLLVADCDLISIRSARRTMDAWERLNIRADDEVRLVVNRSSKQREIQPDLVAKLVRLPLLAAVPFVPDEVEGQVNTGTLTAARPASIVRVAGPILSLCTDTAPVPRKTASKRDAKAARPRRAGARALADERGSSVLELPVFVMLFMTAFFVCVQGLALGLGHLVAGNAANEAARQASVGVSTAELRQVTDHAMLGFNFTSQLQIDRGAHRVTVEVGVPKVFGWLPEGLNSASAQASYVPEPGT